jgi:VCBS repeat-containing protein
VPMTRALAGALALVVLLGQASSQLVAQAPQPLKFFKNYLLTGDYAVQGIGLRGSGTGGFASGDIVIPACAEGDTERLGCVPRGVDIAAAFLYWQVIGDQDDPQAGARGVRFHDQPLSLSGDVEILFGKTLGLGSPPCWSNGGGTGGGSGSRNLTFTYRTDALRFLDIDPQTGKTAGYGSHRVRLPDSRRSTALGASLVIVYRDSSLPYSAIVLYDGAYAVANGSPGMTLGVEGFYDADDVDTRGKITHIVGSGQANKGEKVFYNATTWDNPFTGAAGPNWDNPTFPVTVDPSLRAIQTGALPQSGSFDCLTWAAVVYRTPLNDDDGDGLLNRWETSAEPITDPYGRTLPMLSKMGADPTVRDIFMEINYLKTDVARTYGADQYPAHTHAPDPEAIRLFGDMFKARGINVHIDLGQAYGVGSVAEPYLIRDTVPGDGLARGGEAIDESLTVCEAPAGSPPWACQFSAFPGTVGWKTGLRRIRDSFKTGQAGECDVEGSTCERAFDEVRMDIFRYALFSHFIGLPKSTRPCLDGSLTPIEDVAGACPAGASLNPDFRIPRTYSGVADFGGGDLIVSLGGFKNTAGLPVGTPFMQASTLAHEFGHTAERRHGSEPFEPNCNPSYLSVMNYLYQLRGLLDDSGSPTLDFAEGTPFVDVDEAAVREGVLSASRFRLSWYAPIDFSYLKDRREPIKSRCDGSPLAPGERMVRIDARSSAAPIDWNANDVIESNLFAQDVNFSGTMNGTGSGAVSGPLKGFLDDWSNLALNQVGARRNVGGLYRLADGTLAVGPLSLHLGKVDLSPSDMGKVDLELGKVDLFAGKVDLEFGKVDLDFGKVDLSLGKVDLSSGKVDLDLGAAESGSGDIGRGDAGGGDLNVNDPANPPGEIDATLAAGLARTAPNNLRVCVVDAGCAAPGADLHDVAARFVAPHIGGVASFTLYRVEGPTLRPGLPWTLAGTVVGDPTNPDHEDYVIIDPANLVDGRPYTYFVVTNYAADGAQGAIDSEPSNQVTITAVDRALVAGADAYTTSQDTPLRVAAPGVLANDGDEDSAVTWQASLVSGPAHGTVVLDADGSFTYTPALNFTGTDVFTYRPAAGSSVIGTVTITVAPVAAGTYQFVGLKNAPPPAGTVLKAGSAVPMQWQFRQGSVAVDSAGLTFDVVVAGPAPSPTIRNTDTGNSNFRYQDSSRTWVFNLQTKETNGKALPAGEYRVTITPRDTRFAAGSFAIRLGQ